MAPHPPPTPHLKTAPDPDQRLPHPPTTSSSAVRRTHTILYWDCDGFALWYKRLEEGTFRLPSAKNTGNVASLELKASELAMLLEGIDLVSIKRRKRFTPGAQKM
jgi:transposase